MSNQLTTILNHTVYFETSHHLNEDKAYSSITLDDEGCGISYGINGFNQRTGSLKKLLNLI